MFFMRKINFYEMCLLSISFFSTDMNALLRPSKEVAEMRAMMMRKHQPKMSLLRERQRQLKSAIASLGPNEFFVYREGTSDGIRVPKNTIMLCENIAPFIQLKTKEGEPVRAIPISPIYSFETIRKVFLILESQKSEDELIQSLSMLTPEQLVNYANFALYLGVKTKIEDIFVEEIVNKIMDRYDELVKISQNVQFTAFGSFEKYSFSELLAEIQKRTNKIEEIRKNLLELTADNRVFDDLSPLLGTRIMELFKKRLSKKAEERFKSAQDLYQFHKEYLNDPEKFLIQIYLQHYWDISISDFYKEFIVLWDNKKLKIGEFLDLIKSYIKSSLGRREEDITQLKAEQHRFIPTLYRLFGK